MALLRFSQFNHEGEQICPWRKIGLGQPRVINYIIFRELKSLMLHAKFKEHRTFWLLGKCFEDF